MGTILFAPRSTGTVKLKSTDPRENPIIDNNFLADPLDLLVQTEGVMLSDEIITKGAGTKDIIKGYWLQSISIARLQEKCVLTCSQTCQINLPLDVTTG